MFGSALDVLATQNLVPGHPGNVRYEFPSRHGLQIRSIILWSLPQCCTTIFQGYLNEGQIVHQGFVAGLVSQFHHWEPYLVTQYGLFRISILHY